MFFIYAAYFAGGGQRGIQKTVRCALGFIVGAVVVFVSIGFFPAYTGRLLRHQRTVNWICGSIVTVFGLNTLGLFRRNLPSSGSRVLDAQDMTFFSAALFGILLASVMMPGTAGGYAFCAVAGAATYVLGLGIPFLISAVFIDWLKGVSSWVKGHSRAINLLSGSILILAGLLMASGILGRLLGYMRQNLH